MRRNNISIGDVVEYTSILLGDSSRFGIVREILFISDSENKKYIGDYVYKVSPFQLSEGYATIEVRLSNIRTVYRRLQNEQNKQ